MFEYIVVHALGIFWVCFGCVLGMFLACFRVDCVYFEKDVAMFWVVFG